MRRTHALLLTTALIACGNAATNPIVPPPPPPGAGLKIVMLGNSLTDAWDIPGMIADLATRAGQPRPTVLAVTFANFSLEDHWNQPQSQAAVDAGDADVVVMQQGPSTLAASGADLLEWTGQWATRIRTNGGRPGLYVVWPPFGGEIDNGISNYVAAADAHDTAIYPVGQAFRSLMTSHPDLPLYLADGFHPSPHGAWLAAMIISAVIYDVDPTTLGEPFSVDISAVEATALRQAAKTAIDLYGRP
jgi:hypothetical protein